MRVRTESNKLQTFKPIYMAVKSGGSGIGGRDLHPIRLLRRSATGPYFSKPIMANRVRVSSSNTRATQPDRHINGFKGLKLVTLSSHSQFLLSLSPLSVTIFATRRRSCLSSILPLRRRSVPLHHRSSLFARNVPARLRLHLSNIVDLFHLLGSFICGFVDLWICSLGFCSLD